MKNIRKVITAAAAALLAGVCILGSGCGEPAPQDVSEVPVTEQESVPVTSQTDAVDMGVFDRELTIRDEISDYGFIIRRYYSSEYGQVAESFGYEEPRDVFRDIDGDGRSELICSVMFGGDGVAKALIYKWDAETETVMVGQVMRDEKYLPGLYDWGAGAVMAEYSLHDNCIVVEYRAGEEAGDHATVSFPLDSEAIGYRPYVGN